MHSSLKPSIKIIFKLFIRAEYDCSQNRDDRNTNLLEILKVGNVLHLLMNIQLMTPR